MAKCTHSVNEKDTARIDGLCPLCLKEQVERLKETLEIIKRNTEGGAVTILWVKDFVKHALEGKVKDVGA